MSSAVDPNLAPVIVAGGGGGGASLPDDPAAVLLDVASPSTFVVLDPAGVGAAITPADARAALYPLTPVTTASGWTTGGTGGTVTQGASTLALTITSGQSGVQTNAYVPYATKATTAGPRKRLRFRVAMTPAGTVTNVILWVGFGTAAGTARGPAVYALIRGDGLVELAAGLSDGSLVATIAQSSTGALPLDGTGWVELSDDGGLVSLVYGTGTSSDPPAAEAWVSLAGYAAVASVRGARAAVVAQFTQWTNGGAQAASLADISVQVIP